MDYFPVFLDLKNKKCVIVGGGEVAHRKAKAVLKSGAMNTLVKANASALPRLIVFSVANASVETVAV